MNNWINITPYNKCNWNGSCKVLQRYYFILNWSEAKRIDNLISACFLKFYSNIIFFLRI